MKTMIKLSFVLGIYAAVACVALAGVYILTAPRIAAAARAEVNASLGAIFPEADDFVDVTEEVESPASQIAFNGAFVAKKGDEVLGMVVKATGATYKSTTLLVGVDMKRALKPLVFMENTDTPGLGTKTSEEPFVGQFSGKSLDDGYAVGKDIQAISGATISSKGVAVIARVAGYAAGEYLAASHGAPAGTGAAPVVAELAPMADERALSELFPDCEFEKIEGLANGLEKTIVFDASWLAKSGGKIAGVAIKARGQTYKASTLIVGVKLDRTLAGMRVSATSDSKNYGYEMLNPEFYGRFAGMSADSPFTVRAGSAGEDASGEKVPADGIDSISGATVTTLGVANIVKVASLSGAAYLADGKGGAGSPANASPLVLNELPEQE